MSPPQVLFDDDHLRVVFQPGGSDWLLVTFGDASTRADGVHFYANTIVKKLELNCLGFMAKAPNWYPTESMRAALPAIDYTLRAFHTRLFYGSSMGAYAAIKYSRLLRATHVVAYSPQWSIDPAECGGNPSGYEPDYRSRMQGMGIRRADAGGSINVFYDPWHVIDTWHFRMIEAACGTVRGYRVPYADHHVVAVLKGSGTAAEIWDGCLRDDGVQVYRALNGARRKSGFRRQYLLLRLVHRQPLLALRLIAKLRAQERLDLPHPPLVLVPLLRALVRQGGGAAALRLLDTVPSFLKGTRREVVLRQIGAPGAEAWRRGLLTAHGTHLVYCALEGRLMHVAPPATWAAAIGLFGVFICERSGFLSLAIETGGSVMACALREDARMELVWPGACDPQDALRPETAMGTGVHVRNRGFFLCAEPDGKIVCDRVRAGPWEIFT